MTHMNSDIDLLRRGTGLEQLRAIIAATAPAPSIAETLGFTLAEVDEGYARFECLVGDHLLNPLGWVHGGIALTLVDSAAGCAVHSRLAAGVGYTTIETKVNFVRPIAANAGLIHAEGHVLSFGRQIATAEAKVWSSDDRLLAHGTSSLMILQTRN